jgi:methionyl-tRNA synthetase
MEKVLIKKEKSERYDFSNKESQRLFEEFTLLLADITKYIEEREQRILYLEEELGRATRIRYMLKELVRKLIRMAYRVMTYIPRKVLKLLKGCKDKLKNLLK